MLEPRLAAGRGMQSCMTGRGAVALERAVASGRALPHFYVSNKNILAEHK